MATKTKRSPLDRTPALRVAGQSLDEELDEVRYDHMLSPMLVALFTTIIACLEWFRYLTNSPPSPWIYSIFAVVMTGYAVFKVLRTRKRVQQLKLGRDGERVVAQYLEWFRTSNFFVFHDVPNGDANVDHVLIGPQGVFTVETKTHTKPLRGECKVTVVNGVVRANGFVIERNPIVQAKAQAGWLRSFLAESQFNVRVWPVVVFPGWFVERFDYQAAGAWVLEVKALSKFIENEPERHSREEVQAMASALRSYIRARMEK
ncbi:nuclease-related domain-containing protein [Rhodoferax sp. BLA1]|uniref:nuclease-related domain-containing protein n=1 Tax=Rhodoferax sp. BLA1 TaxID=2576062 RepID=UPI0015D11F92|nr:nuclease-related domain-containing protein [Rhodoferax sp. BLA1]